MRRRLKPLLFSRFTLAVGALVLISAGAVYAGTKLQETEKGRGSEARVRGDGSLTQEPRPLSLDDVADERRGSPDAAVMRLWYWARWGSAPNIVEAYAPAVVRRLGAADIAGAYGIQRESLAAARPRAIETSRGRAGTTVVTLEALRKNTRPQTYSFTLRRNGRRWVVVFDTLLQSAIASYVQSQSSPNPAAKEVPARAVRAGNLAARTYRVAYLCRERLGGPRTRPPIDAQADC